MDSTLKNLGFLIFWVASELKLLAMTNLRVIARSVSDEATQAIMSLYVKNGILTLAKNSIIVNKFGGNSLKDAEAYRQSAKLLSGEHEVIVVSAAAETTTELQNLLDLVSKQLSYEPALLRLGAMPTNSNYRVN